MVIFMHKLLVHSHEFFLIVIVFLINNERIKGIKLLSQVSILTLVDLLIDATPFSWVFDALSHLLQPFEFALFAFEQCAVHFFDLLLFFLAKALEGTKETQNVVDRLVREWMLELEPYKAFLNLIFAKLGHLFLCKKRLGRLHHFVSLGN